MRTGEGHGMHMSWKQKEILERRRGTSKMGEIQQRTDQTIIICECKCENAAVKPLPLYNHELTWQKSKNRETLHF